MVEALQFLGALVFAMGAAAILKRLDPWLSAPSKVAYENDEIRRLCAGLSESNKHATSGVLHGLSQAVHETRDTERSIVLQGLAKDILSVLEIGAVAGEDEVVVGYLEILLGHLEYRHAMNPVTSEVGVKVLKKLKFHECALSRSGPSGIAVRKRADTLVSMISPERSSASVELLTLSARAAARLGTHDQALPLLLSASRIALDPSVSITARLLVSLIGLLLEQATLEQGPGPATEACHRCIQRLTTDETVEAVRQAPPESVTLVLLLALLLEREGMRDKAELTLQVAARAIAPGSHHDWLPWKIEASARIASRRAVLLAELGQDQSARYARDDARRFVERLSDEAVRASTRISIANDWESSFPEDAAEALATARTEWTAHTTRCPRQHTDVPPVVPLGVIAEWQRGRPSWTSMISCRES